jgi:two-component system cell cycle response regulator CtrA
MDYPPERPATVIELRQQVAHLQAQLDAANAQISVLREASGATLDAPRCLGLTKKEGIIFAMLLKRDFATRESLMLAMYSDRAPSGVPDSKIIDVYISRLRPKLSRYCITIENVFGTGYRMPPDSKSFARQLFERESAA